MILPVWVKGDFSDPQLQQVVVKMFCTSWLCIATLSVCSNIYTILQCFTTLCSLISVIEYKLPKTTKQGEQRQLCRLQHQTKTSYHNKLSFLLSFAKTGFHYCDTCWAILCITVLGMVSGWQLTASGATFMDFRHQAQTLSAALTALRWEQCSGRKWCLAVGRSIINDDKVRFWSNW